MKSFEIQLYRSGAWKTDSIYDDRALAEMEARRMETSARYANLRIIEEVYDEKSDSTKLRTIYRDRAFQEKVAKKSETVRLKDKHNNNTQKRARKYETRRQAKAKSGGNMTKIIINLVLIGVVGIAGMVALQYMSAMQ